MAADAAAGAMTWAWALRARDGANAAADVAAAEVAWTWLLGGWFVAMSLGFLNC